MKISVILPTYNESGNIVELVKAIIEMVPSEWDYEVIVVDDNSPDQTYNLVEKTFTEDDKIKAVLRLSDRGLAKSIRAGIEIAQGDKILVMDTDFTHDPSEIPKMITLSQLFDIVSGSRFCAGGSMENKGRYFMSLLFNWFTRIVLQTQIQDNLAGFWMISSDKIGSLPLEKIFSGYGDYFIALLFYAQRQHMTIIEFPVYYANRTQGKSKSNFLKLLITYTKAIIELRIRYTFEK